MSDRHPDAATMAAFVDGTLPAPEARVLAMHMAECDECVAEAGDISAFAAEERVAAPPKPSHWWGYAAAAALALVVVGSGLYARQGGDIRYRLTMWSLMSATKHSQRPIEPRLSWFPWSERRPVTRGEEEDKDFALEAEAGLVAQNTEDSKEAREQHAHGVAQLFAKERRQDAVATLSRVAAGSHDATIWNDFAAAQYAVGKYKEALSAADYALQLRPNMPEALFNRALILQRLQRDNDAIAAWNQYLAIDSNSNWAKEAESKRNDLQRGY